MRPPGGHGFLSTFGSACGVVYSSSGRCSPGDDAHLARGRKPKKTRKISAHCILNYTVVVGKVLMKEFSSLEKAWCFTFIGSQQLDGEHM